jgi:hypothetical protein
MKPRSPVVVFRHIHRWRPALALVVSTAMLLYTGCATTFVPGDAKATCTDLTQNGAAFASWFENGTVTVDGVVTPADSVQFPDAPNCSFYQWSERMYLWLASPAPPKYGGGGVRIFGSEAFFDVTPLDANGERTLIPHVNGVFPHFMARFSPPGALGLALVAAKDGRMLNVEPPPTGPTGRQLIQNASGQAVEIGRISIEEKRRPLFFDTAGHLIEGARPLRRVLQRKGVSVAKDISTDAAIVQQFNVNNTPVFLDFLGNVVEVEQGQAGGNAVLQAQNGSLVYYTIVVNDVFAYFLTGAKNGGISPQPTQFPTTQAELNDVINFASANGRTLVDPEALAIEVKMSWVEATGLPNPDTYIKTTASIPVYDMTDPLHWVKTGDKVVELAMVGMHVVGSAAGHPEMIWATFEHQSNMPNGQYTYIKSNNALKTVAQNTSGNWLFSSNGSTGPFNDEHMAWSKGNIDANNGFTISPSDTIRRKSWGAATNQKPNPAVPSAAASNTEIISINNTVRSLLLAGDVRQNYIMTGATWTINGAPPSGSFAGTFATNEVGTSKLANGTLETYFQGTNTQFANGTNCFLCHTSDPNLPLATTSVSQIYDPLKALF